MKKIIILCFIFFNVFSIIKSIPFNDDIMKYDSFHIRGDCDRTVLNVYNKALEKSKKPFFEVKNHFLFLSKNPGLFVFIVEMFLRIGIHSVFLMRMFFLLCFNIGVFFLLRWINLLFNNRTVSAAAMVLMSTTPLFLHYSSVMHQWPLDMIFFNITIYLYIKYNKIKDQKYLIGAGASYFLLCQSYYMFYVSTLLMLMGISYVYNKKIFNKSHLMMILPPAISVVLLFLQEINLHGSPYIMLDYLLARSLDIRVPNSAWTNYEHFLSARDFLHYPLTLSKRMKMFFHFDGMIVVAMFLVAIILQKKKEMKIFLGFLILSGMSWNVIMFQHTRIHQFSVTFGYFATMIIFGICFAGIFNLIENRMIETKKIIIYKILFSVIMVIYFIINGIEYDFLNIGYYIKYIY